MDYRVRPERLPTLMKSLEEVRHHIAAATPAQVEIAAPAEELVSIDAVRRLGLDTSLLHYQVNKAHREALENALAAFGATLTDYLAREESGELTFRSN